MNLSLKVNSKRTVLVLVVLLSAVNAEAQVTEQAQILLRGGSNQSRREIDSVSAAMGAVNVRDLVDTQSARIISVPANKQDEWLQRLRDVQKLTGESFTAFRLTGDYRALFQPRQQQNADLSAAQQNALSAIRRVSGVGGQVSLMNIAPPALAREALTVGFDTRDGFTGPGSLSITVPPNRTISLIKDEVSIVEGGYIWRGHPEASPQGLLVDGDAVLVTRGDSITGTLRIGNDTYSIVPLGGGLHAISKRITSDGPPEHPPRFLELIKKSGDSQTKDAPPIQATPISLTDTVNIKLLVIFSNQAWNEVIDHQGLITLGVADLNKSLNDSGIPAVRVSAVGIVKSQYIEVPPWNNHLDRLTKVGDPAFLEIHKMRDDLKADIVIMLLSDQTWCGEAKNVGVTKAEEAFIVLSQICTTAPYYSFSHEIGHIVGARHDRKSDPTNVPEKWAHGYSNGKWRTLMAYDVCDGCPRILRWSNPYLTFNGEPTGTLDFEYDAKEWLDHSKRVAAFRSKGDQ